MKSLKSLNNNGRAKSDEQLECAQRLLCEASAECTADSQGQSTIFCQLGSWVEIYYILMIFFLDEIKMKHKFKVYWFKN